MTGLFDIFRKITLRRKCSDCGMNGKRIDHKHVHCNNCNSTWDGSEEMTQAVVLVKEANTVVPLL